MGKIMHLGEEYSSDGTTVIPNPEGEATDDLNTVQIGEDIFNVVGSGGGGSTIALPSLYSTKEKMVGLWTDNKPLYQKTWTGLNFQPTASGVELPTAINSDLQVAEVVVKAFGQRITNNGQATIPLYVWNANGTYRALCTDAWSNTSVVTIQYTKTTDTPVEDFNLQDFGIFAPVIYSTEEREIGVWTDGKPLYEKNIVFTATKNTGTGSQTYPHNIPNIDKIWVSETHGNIDTPRPQNNSYAISVTVTTTDIYVETGVDRRTVVVDVTLRYTKTTDVPGSGSYAELGVPAVHYDDTERVIGTYLGDTLYKKTVVVPTLTMANGQMMVSTSDFLNVNKMTDWKCNLYDPVNKRNYNIPYIRINDNESLHLQMHRLTDGSVSVNIFCRGSNYNDRTFQDVEFTLEYTKTTT